MANFKLKTQHILALSDILGEEKTKLLTHVYQHGSNGNRLQQTFNSISEELRIPFESVWKGITELHHRGLIKKGPGEDRIFFPDYYIDYSCIEQLGNLLTKQHKHKTHS